MHEKRKLNCFLPDKNVAKMYQVVSANVSRPIKKMAIRLKKTCRQKQQWLLCVVTTGSRFLRGPWVTVGHPSTHLFSPHS